MWAYESVFYQIYPIGFCGAPRVNDGITVPRIRKAADWAEHIARLGCNAVYFSPIFESDSHGYDTRDFRKVDCRLGTNADFAAVCETLHEHGIKVVLDGVFNHVGRGFWAFRDVQEKKWGSPYKDWFHISFEGNSNYNDGFWYEGWEGHYELVKLNLRNPDVVHHLFDCIRLWKEEFGMTVCAWTSPTASTRIFSVSSARSATRSAWISSSSASCCTATTINSSGTVCCTPARITSATRVCIPR